MANFRNRIDYATPTISFTFPYPPEGEPFGDRFRTNQRTTFSSLGTAQTNFNYNEKSYRITQTFVTEAIKSAYETFFLNHASKGLPFNFFPSSDEAEFFTVTLLRFEFNPVRLYSINTPGNYEYRFQMQFREVV